MTHIKNLHAVMEYDEGDISIRVPYAFEEIENVAWDDQLELTIGRDGADLVVTITRSVADQKR